jgi:hypothetical protein
MTTEDRYLNLAMINIGEALTEFGNVRQRGGQPGLFAGDFANVRLSLLRAVSALETTIWAAPEPAPQHEQGVGK